MPIQLELLGISQTLPHQIPNDTSHTQREKRNEDMRHRVENTNSISITLTQMPPISHTKMFITRRFTVQTFTHLPISPFHTNSKQPYTQRCTHTDTYTHRTTDPCPVACTVVAVQHRVYEGISGITEEGIAVP